MIKKVVHIIIGATYREGWGYQENILPKKHRELGFDTHVVTYNQYNSYPTTPQTYTNNNDVHVHVLKSRRLSLLEKIPKIRGFILPHRNITIGLLNKLEELHPSIIFVHGVYCHDHYEVLKYMRHNPNTMLYVDSHSDYYNGPIVGFKGLMTRYYGGKLGKRLSSVARKMWGVTPWRVTYLQDIYKVPANKTSLLVMGGEEDLIDYSNKKTIRKTIRNKYNIPQDAFLIVTGGKIDKAKNIHILARAVAELRDRNVELLIFGKKSPDIEKLSDFNYPNIKDVGWIEATKCYDLFLASDLAAFPGTHSVLWEQACACGIPGIYKDWDGGFSHIDVGGNVMLLKDISVDSLKDSIIEILNTSKFYKMKEAAEDKARKEFSYIEIAKRSIEYDKFEGQAE